MFGNLWLSSALAVVAIFSASVAYKSYQDIKEVKEIKESYEILSSIKTLLASQYNKSPNEITRDEIIAYLPQGGSWEKLLLLNRKSDGTISTDAIVDENGNFLISENERLKLLALRNKLEKYGNPTGITQDSTNFTVVIGEKEKNIVQKDLSIQRAVQKAIEYLALNILYSNTITITEIEDFVNDSLDYAPLDDIYQDMSKATDTGVIENDVLIARKKEYFKQRIKDKLLENKNAFDSKLYYLTKDFLD